MNRIVVSVVIPSYNHERFIREAMDSVLAQTLADLELIVIDDGSVDGSREIIRACAATDPRVRVFEQANAGAHAAINRGITLARGEFVAILNSDDRYAPSRLARLLDFCNATESLDFAVTAVRLIDDESRLIDDPAHWWNAMMRDYAARVRDVGIVEGLLYGNFTASTSNFFFRRTLFTTLGPLRYYRYVMDWEYALRAALRAPGKFGYLAEEPLLDYRLHGKNTILSGMPRSAMEAADVERRVLREHFRVPRALLASQHRHQRLLRMYRSAAVAAERDAYWEPILEQCTRGWAATRDGWAETRAELATAAEARAELSHTVAETRAELAHTVDELARVTGSRSYRLGRALTAPARWLRRQRLAVARPAPLQGATQAQAERTAIRYSMLVPKPTPEDAVPLRLAVHLHLHYEDLLSELARYISNIPEPFDLFVTVHERSPAVAAELTRHFPSVEILVVENRGKDVGGFIAALDRFSLDRYDLVLKIHSKKSLNLDTYIGVVQQLFGADVVDGAAWRQQLLAPVLGSRDAVARVLAAFRTDASLGMVGSAKFVCSAPDADAALYESLCDRLGVSTEVLFFAGTMFWIRGTPLKRIREARFTIDDFSFAGEPTVEGTLEHCFERVFGALVAACGYTVGGI